MQELGATHGEVAVSVGKFKYINVVLISLGNPPGMTEKSNDLLCNSGAYCYVQGYAFKLVFLFILYSILIS